MGTTAKRGGPAPAVNSPSPTDAESWNALSDAMGLAWIHFGATGDPNGLGAPAWPEAEAGTDLHVIFDVPPATGDGVRTEQCDFWDSLAP